MHISTDENIKAVKLVIHGKVQGVFYRKSTREKAIQFKISGFVRNCNNGTVEVFAEGKDENLNLFIAWCNIGPPGAKVTHIDIHECPLKNFQDFIISR